MNGVEDDPDNKNLNPEVFEGEPESNKAVPLDEFVGPRQKLIEEQKLIYEQRIQAILKEREPKSGGGDKMVRAILDIIEGLRNETADGKQFLGPGEAWVEYNQQLNEYAGRLLFKGFESGTMPLPLFYIYPEKWADVCNTKDYPLREKALTIIQEKVGDILDIVTPEDSEKLRIYDFGVGVGKKSEIILNEAIEKNGRFIEYHGVDASEEMLRIALTQIAKNIMDRALDLKTLKCKERRANKWKNLIKFLKIYDREYSLSPEWLNKAFKSIFAKHYNDPEKVDLLKFMFARMISLHKGNPKEAAMIEELDTDVKLPLAMYAHPKWFQDLNPDEFIPNEKEGVVIFDLGSEICNQFPGNSIEMLHDLLPEPTTPGHPEGIVLLDEEKSVHTTYVVMGLQLGEIPTSQKHFREIRTQMRGAYNNKAFCSLTSHPFLREDIKYIDSNTKTEMKFEDVGFIYVDYEEDNDNPGYYGTTHRLYVTEDVEVHNAEGVKLHLAGKERACDVFRRTVEALFDPEKEEKLRGRRNEVMRVLGLSTKEELLATDPKVFFSKDYSNYRSGMHIAKKALNPNKDPDKEINLEQTLLYPSYKPSLEQIIQLCHERGLKIIEIYSDNEEKPTYVKILTRRMTKAEEDLYRNGDYDKSIFYTPKAESTHITRPRRRNEQRARNITASKTARARKLPSTKYA